VLFKPFLESSPMVVKAEFIIDPKANAVGFNMLASAQMRKIASSGVHREDA